MAVRMTPTSPRAAGWTGRRRRLLGGAAGAVLVLAVVTGCNSQPGAAVLVAGTTVSESTVQEDATAFLTQNPTVAPTDATRALANRAQITFRVRHVLIDRALSAAGVTVTAAQVNSAAASVSQQGQSLAAQLDLPASAEPDIIHDLVALQMLVAKLPPSGVGIQDVKVTAQGLTASSRDQAVSMRSEYLSDPAAMDRAVAAAAQGQAVPRTTFDLLQRPELGSTGLFRPSTGEISILPQSDNYLVLRTTGRTVSTTTLEKTRFNSVSAVGDAFDVGALLVSGQQGSAGISVNPRFGVWDPASVQVVPGNSGL